MAMLRTSYTISKETEIVSAQNGRRSIGELIDMHIRTEWAEVTDQHGKADLSEVRFMFNDEDQDMLSALYTPRKAY